MQKQVFKIHSDFYYVKDNKHNTYTCKIRDILKKQKTEIIVGDFVELDKDNNFITKRLKRKNYLQRPKVANIDTALVVTAFQEPQLDYTQLNRYLIYLKYHNINAMICINKEDLENNPSLKKSEIDKIYNKLGYKIFYISAKKDIGIDELKKEIKNKTIVLCGLSGVGKTTLISKLNPNYIATTNNVSQKTRRGTHTTRHCEIIENDSFNLIDTPGFSCLRFDFLLPEKLFELFCDLVKYKSNCKYANCNHDINQKGICSVVDNLDKIEPTRYYSYLEFLKEALEYKKAISKKSIKKESDTKFTGNKVYTKISKKKRNLSRKAQKQNIKGENE